MLKAGLTGGLATGKSLVGQALADLGCLLIKADELGHRVIEPEGEAHESVVREFGTEILNERGEIDRRRLAAQVFGKPERLALLNSLVHPPVIQREARIMEQAALADPDAIVVVEAAILIETGHHLRFDKLILTVCEEEQQIERAMERGDAREEVLARIRNQMPLAEKRKFADYVIDTSGSKKETLRQTREVYNLLRSIST